VELVSEGVENLHFYKRSTGPELKPGRVSRPWREAAQHRCPNWRKTPHNLPLGQNNGHSFSGTQLPEIFFMPLLPKHPKIY